MKQSVVYSWPAFILSYETGTAIPHDPEETCFTSIIVAYIPQYYQIAMDYFY